MTITKISKKLIPIYIVLTSILWCVLTALGTDAYTKFNKSFCYTVNFRIPGPESFGADGAGFLGELVMLIFLFIALSQYFLLLK